MTAILADHGLASAEQALRLVTADAHGAVRLAEAALAGANSEVRSVAERALGLAAIELGRGEAAVAHLRSAVAAARASGSVVRVGEARMSLSWALALRGEIDAALAEAERAAPLLGGSELARLEAQRALILQRLGRLDEALAGYRRPLATFRRTGDRLWEARLLCNRGVVQVYRGALAAAEADFRRAEALHVASEQPLAATQVRHNLGWVAARRGDVPAALSWYDRVEAEYRAHGVPLALLLMDRCELLLSARLIAEARDGARAAVAELEAAGMDSDLAEAHLLAAHASLLAGDAAAASIHAAAADTGFTGQSRAPWSALARAASAQAIWLDAGSVTPAPQTSRTNLEFVTSAVLNSRFVRPDAASPALEDALTAALDAVRTLTAAGWHAQALDARVIAGQAALALGRPRLAQRQLERAAAARHRGPVQVRTRAWHAAALLRLASGDRRGASAAVTHGLRALEAHRMALGASELRAHAAGHGEELATLGLRLALASGRADRVLAAAERHRAAALLQRPARPPDDPALAAELEELRRVTAALDEALRDGRPDPTLARRQSVLERSIRRRALRTPPHPTRGAAPHAVPAPAAIATTRGAAPHAAPAPGGGTGSRHRRGAAGLRAALGGRVLVEHLAVDGDLYAVTVGARACALHRLGPVEEVEREAASLRFAVRSVATGGSRREAMRGLCFTVAERLDALLIAPLRLRSQAPLVIVPTGALHALPWALLPSLTDRPLTVAPSARLWQRAQAASAATETRTAASAASLADSRTVLVAGPRLPAAGREVAALAARLPHATTLVGADATVAAVAHAIDGAAEAHIAAHGRFRDDNPQFCSLELADGALTVYDLERLRQPPRRLILSSCESGLATVHAGGELMGFTAALFALGTATVIAAVVPVPDDATEGLMLALQTQLSKGVPPAEALRCARHDRDPIASAAFICFGAG